MGVLWGKIMEGVVRYWPLTNSFFLLGVFTSVPILVKIDLEMRRHKHAFLTLNCTFSATFENLLFNRAFAPTTLTQGFRKAFWVGRTYARGSIFGRMVRPGYRFSAYATGHTRSVPIFGIISDLLETTKPTSKYARVYIEWLTTSDG